MTKNGNCLLSFVLCWGFRTESITSKLEMVGDAHPTLLPGRCYLSLVIGRLLLVIRDR